MNINNYEKQSHVDNNNQQNENKKSELSLCSMTKKGRKKKHCQVHTFEMKGLESHLRYKTKTVIKLCPENNEKTNVMENIFPTFNNDGMSHLPSFSLPFDQDYIKNNTAKFLNDHNQRVLDQLAPKTQLLQPKPNKKNNCGVCRTTFTEYREHIKQSTHKQRINNNKFNGFILELCSSYAKRQREEYEGYDHQQNSQSYLKDRVTKCRILQGISCTASQEQQNPNSPLLKLL